MKSFRGSTKQVQGTVMLDGDVLGKAVVSYKTQDPTRPGSTHMMCRACGKVWGSLILRTFWTDNHSVLMVPCAEHGGGVFHTRSEYEDTSRYLIDWDEDVLRHDFLVMYDWLEGVKSPDSHLLLDSPARTVFIGSRKKL